MQALESAQKGSMHSMRDDQLFLFPAAVPHLPEIDEWLSGDPPALMNLARRCFAHFRQCGDDVHELLHDGCPTACVGGAAFGHVNVFKQHINVGFFAGAFLLDPDALLLGSGKCMRHVKLLPQDDPDAPALIALIKSAYLDMQTRTR